MGKNKNGYVRNGMGYSQVGIANREKGKSLIVPLIVQCGYKPRTFFVMKKIDVESWPNLDLAHIPLRIVPAVNGLGEAVVLDDVPNAADGEEEGHDPRHPSERHDRRQQSTRGVNAAPAKIAPLLGGDGGTNDPKDEQQQEHDHLPAEG